jgi:hypothetical protein
MFQKAEKQVEKREKLIPSNKDDEKRRKEQIRRLNQSKETNENEMRSSQATIQVQNSCNTIQLQYYRALNTIQYSNPHTLTRKGIFSEM